MSYRCAIGLYEVAHNWIVGGLPLGPLPPVSPADYVVNNDTELSAVLANTDATLANKTIEKVGTNYGPRTISGRNFTAAGGPLTIRSADASSYFPRMITLANNDGLRFECNFQMTGWPKNDLACIFFDGGTHDNYDFVGATFRHGYGPSQVDFDTSFQYPEYTRVDNVQTATTTDTTYALTWQDPAATGAWIEFFNRGTEDVVVALGGAGINTSGTTTTCPAGILTRLTFIGDNTNAFRKIDPTQDTHIAIKTAAGTSEVNPRTEIGIKEYLADAFVSSGSADIGRVHFKNCVLRDLNNAFKGILFPEEFVAMDNDLLRIYQDIFAVSPSDTGTAYFERNLDCVPFSRSGIAEGLNGDARDPHGDGYQGFGFGTGVIGPITIAGNRTRTGILRADVLQQFIFLSDNDNTPSYSDVKVISVTGLGGLTRALNIGEAGFPARNVMIWGATAVDYSDVTSTLPQLDIVHDQPENIFVGNIIAGNTANDGDFGQEGNVFLKDVVDPAAVFPNFGDLATATTRAEIEAALTTAAEGAGVGAVATANAIDWNTSDHTAVVLYENVPSGADWVAATGVAINTLYEFPLAKVLNPRDNQPVVPGPGEEWRAVDTDGVTEVQAWTSSSGTINGGQFIQPRKQSSSDPVTEVPIAMTINGFPVSTSITTAQATPSVFLTQPATAANFVDPANVPASTSRITFRGWFYFSSLTTCLMFAQESTGCDLQLLSSGSVQILKVEDGTGASMILNHTTGITMAINTWYEVLFDVDQVAETATVTINGTTVVVPFTAASNGVFQSNREVSFAGTSATGSVPPSGSRLADLEVDFNGTLHKAIGNVAATANADPWKRGAGIYT